jgi:putative sterol carrier protein
MSAFPEYGGLGLGRLRRLVSEAPGQLADGVAKVVRDAPDDRIDWLMRTPARRAILDGIFWQMPRHLDRKRATGVSAAVRWRITGRSDGGSDIYYLEVTDGEAQVVRSDPAVEPRVTITLDGAEFLRIVTGNADAMRSYFTGRMTIAGDILTAGKLVTLFRVPKTGRAAPPGGFPGL